MTPALIGSIITVVFQFLAIGALTFMILEQRRMDRELKALQRWLIELDESIPVKGRIPPYRVESSLRQPSEEGPPGSGRIRTDGKADPRSWN